ncbi:MAG: class I SAM-dependent methyltransferase [Candidatus Malihini olakiniferum]
MTLSDVNYGWGGLASYACHHYGASVYSVTISREQQKLA